MIMRQFSAKQEEEHTKNRAFLMNGQFVKGNLSNHIYIYPMVMNMFNDDCTTVASGRSASIRSGIALLLPQLSKSFGVRPQVSPVFDPASTVPAPRRRVAPLRNMGRSLVFATAPSVANHGTPLLRCKNEV